MIGGDTARLPFTAVALVVGMGGPQPARLVWLAVVGVATIAGVCAGVLLDRVAPARAA